MWGWHIFEDFPYGSELLYYKLPRDVSETDKYTHVMMAHMHMHDKTIRGNCWTPVVVVFFEFFMRDHDRQGNST
jgi:hypothetical protein